MFIYLSCANIIHIPVLLLLLLLQQRNSKSIMNNRLITSSIMTALALTLSAVVALGTDGVTGKIVSCSA